jgi:choline-sulfatase
MHYDRTCRYGFTEIGGNMNNSDMKGGGYRRKADDLKVRTGNKESARFENFHAGDSSPILNHDRAVTKGISEFLSHRKPSDKPFFLIAGYLAPHFPLIVPEQYWLHYKDKVPMPVVPPGYLDSLPLNYRHLRVGFNVTDVDPATVKKGRELYYGLTEWLDNEVGKTLAALESAGLADNTVVVYTTDHGENMGEHGLWWKNCMFDTAARIPLIVSWPKRWPGGQHRPGACSLVDVVQTIAELGGTHPPRDWNGDSLVPYLNDPKHTWKDMAVSEYYAHNIASGYAMIRKGKYKYVYHASADAQHPAQHELYDLAADPGELQNLAENPDEYPLVTAMHQALGKELGKSPEDTEKRFRQATSRPRRP